MSDEVSNREKIHALWTVAGHRPIFTVSIIVLSFLTAALEGIGLGFLVPIIEQANSGGASPEANSGALGVFARAYEFLGIPFALEYVILGAMLVMTVRFSASFLVSWLRASLQTNYIRHLQTQLFENTLRARIAYFDRRGSDEILNAIVTQTTHAGRVIKTTVQILEQSLISFVYLAIALYLAPLLTISMAVVLGGGAYLIRNVLESGFDIGDRVAEANEQIQEAVQAGTQGIRDVKLFGLSEELLADFRVAVNQYAVSSIKITRNDAAIENFYRLIVALAVFSLLYFAVTFASMSLSGLGVFLFAIFRLGPKVSVLNRQFYRMEGNLPHLVRTQQYNDELENFEEPNPSNEKLPQKVDRVQFDDVKFAYDTSEKVIDGLSFSVERGEFVAFVGPSGAGKSTIVSLLTRLYDSDSGTIEADTIPIDEVDLDEWRSRVSVVRQNNYIFNDTLKYNVTIGNRDAKQEEIERVCEIAEVTEFVDDLPNGYETQLGDDGVRLSGGQRQRIAIARALIEDSDVLVLDEATSDLDMALEEKVHSGIEAMDRDYAVIVIAHRLSTVTNADRIFAMRDGRIVERGNHQELLENEGEYASLYSVSA